MAILVSISLILCFSLICIFLGLGCLPVSALQQEQTESGTDFSSLLFLSQGWSSINTPQRANIPEKKFSGDRSSHSFTQNYPSQPSNLLILWIWMWCSTFSVKKNFKTVLFQEGPKLTSRFFPVWHWVLLLCDVSDWCEDMVHQEKVESFFSKYSDSFSNARPPNITLSSICR